MLHEHSNFLGSSIISIVQSNLLGDS